MSNTDANANTMLPSHAMNVAQAELSDYKALLNNPARNLKFPSRIESTYQTYLTGLFYSTSRSLLLIGLPMYTSFLLVDYFFYPEQFVVIAIYRLMVIACLLYLGYAKTLNLPMPLSQMNAFLVGLMLCCVQVTLSSLVFEALLGLIYAIGMVAIYVYAIIVLRVSFRHTVLFCLFYNACVLVIAAGSYIGRDLPELMEAFYLRVIGPSILVMLIISVMGLFMSYAIDRLTRRDWLNAQIIEFESQQLNLVSRQLKKLSETDDLTGLYNRRFFDNRFKHAWQHAETMQQSVAVAMIDVDWFKSYNDNYGHAMGDDTLKQIAQCLNQVAGQYDCTLARYGGEEFILVMSNATPDMLTKVGEQLTTAVADIQLRHAWSPFGFCTISVGIGLAFPHETMHHASSYDQRIAKALKAIDDALYVAKSEGKNRVVTAELSA